MLMYAGLIVFTRIRCGPSSHAMLRAIWSTADLEVLYDTHSWPYPKNISLICRTLFKTREYRRPCSNHVR